MIRAPVMDTAPHAATPHPRGPKACAPPPPATQPPQGGIHDRRSERLLRAWEHGRSERGASAVELAMLTPLLIIIIAGTIQFAMLYHARHVALAAAQAGARVARATAGQPGAAWEQPAREKTVAYLRAIGPNLLEAPQPLLLRRFAGGQLVDVGVEVRGTAVRVIPFLTLRVDEQSRGPVERFIPDN
jgi:TadE-like protein